MKILYDMQIAALEDALDLLRAMEYCDAGEVGAIARETVIGLEHLLTEVRNLNNEM